MCGIAAIFAYRQGAAPVRNEDVMRVRDAMAHRGPDEVGSWMSADRRLAFGHLRLSIIDLSPGGSQPMRLEEAGLCLTFNGQIYNYKDLRQKLSDAGHVFRSNSDTEVLLHAYQQYGERVVEHLRGMYAFAI
jgi:asparagine synthase (glutamine-hydrolysing)